MLLAYTGIVLSYDEAIIRFIGRSSNTRMDSHKPIKVGCESMVLSIPGHSHGYFYALYLRGMGGSLDGLV